MATYTTNLRWTKIDTGDETGTWGSTTNGTYDLIDDSFGFVSHANGDSNETITISDGSASDARYMVIVVTGTLTANRTITLAPNTLQKVWFIKNSTSGGFSILISQGSGANVTIANGDTAMVYGDGAGAGAAINNVFENMTLTGLSATTLSGTTVTATTALQAGGGTYATSGAVRLANNSSIAWRNAANSANVTLTVDASDNLVTTADVYAPVLVLGSTAAAAGVIRMANQASVRWRNAANSADVQLYVSSSDNLVTTTNFSASADSTYSLGSSGVRWQNGYFDALTVGGRVVFDVDSSAVDGMVGRTATSGILIQGVAGSSYDFNLVTPTTSTSLLNNPTGTTRLDTRELWPLTDSAFNLGASARRWSTLYVDNEIVTDYVAIGSTVAAAGNVRLPNNTSVRWRNAANTGDLYLLLNGSDSLVANTTFHPATDASHSLGVGTYRWLDAYVSNSVRVGSTVATDGAIRLENNSPIRWRNAANSSNITGLNLNSSDQLAVGAVLVPGVDSSYNLGASTLRWESIYGERAILGTNPSSSGLVRLPNNSGIYWRNAANSADFGLYFDTSNDFRLEADLAPSTDSAFNFGTPTFRWNGGYFVEVVTSSATIGTNAATSGSVKLANSGTIQWRNAANTGNVLMRVNTSDLFEFGATLVPQASQGLGTSGTRWANGYFTAIDATQITGTLQTAAQTNITSLGALSSLNVDGTATMRAIAVETDSTYDFGATGARWATGYLDDVVVTDSVLLDGTQPDLALSDPAVNHGRGVTYGYSGGNNAFIAFAIRQPSAGGAEFNVMMEDNTTANPLLFRVTGGQGGATKTSSQVGMIDMRATEHDNAGNTVAHANADANLFSVRGDTRTAFIIAADGDYHYDGADGGAFDSYDDAALVRAFAVATSDPRQIIKTEFDEFVRYNEDDLVRAGILGARVSEGGLVNGAQLQRLHTGAIWQNATRARKLEEALREIIDMNPSLVGGEKVRYLIES